MEALRGKDFMINHGVADDNVHYQQSMMLIKVLFSKQDLDWVWAPKRENQNIKNQSAEI